MQYNLVFLTLHAVNKYQFHFIITAATYVCRKRTNNLWTTMSIIIHR